jgi:hypothetical protein
VLSVEICKYWYDRREWYSKRGPEHLHHSLDSSERSAGTCPVCELFVRGLHAKGTKKICQEDRVTRGRVDVSSLQFGSLRDNQVELTFRKEEASQQVKARISLYPTGIVLRSSHPFHITDLIFGSRRNPFSCWTGQTIQRL